MSDKDKKKEEKDKDSLMIGAVVGSIVAILGVGVFGYFYWNRSKESKRLKG